MTTEARLSAALADRYRLDRKLGQGGMAVVYLAEELKHGRKVAIKVLNPELCAVIGRDRFLAEIRTTASLQHPHVLGLIDSGEADGLLYYVMPFVEGETLRARLTREKQLPLDDALQLTREVASALEFAHKLGIVHRDIKPENILLQDGQALVADFGIALAVQQAGGSRMTQTGMSLGTPAYMSPEQAMGERDIDRRSDLYSLAIVLYESLVGEPPYDGATPLAITARKLSEPVPPLRSVREGVPQSVETAIVRALARARADRYRSCAEFTVALEAAPFTSTPAPRGRDRRMLWLAGSAAGVLLIAGALALTLRRPLPATVHIGKRTIVATGAGPSLVPDLSPDGKLVTFTSTTGAVETVWVQQADGGNPIQVAKQLDNPRFGVFSPAGDRILLMATGGLFIVPTLGGQARLVVPSRGTRGLLWGTWSPDASRIAYVLDDTLFTQRIDSAPTAIAHGAELHSPAWSPDGRWIAFVSGNKFTYYGNVAPSALHLVPAVGGPEHAITDSSALNSSPAWLPGSRALLFISNRDGGRDVYQLPLKASGAPAGAPTRVTTGLDVGRISLSADGRKLAWSVVTRTANIWSLPILPRDSQPMSRARQETSGRQLIENLDISPDSRWLVYDSDRSGNQDIWRIPLAGGPPEQVTDDPADDFQPAVSPDGREVAFHSMRTGNRDIFVAPIAGGPATRISTALADDADVAWSPDGRALIWESQGRSNAAAWIARRRSDGAWMAPELLPLGRAQNVAWSPDGRWISYADSVGTALWSPVDGARRRLATGVRMEFYTWAEDGHSLRGSALVRDGAGGLDSLRWATLELTVDGKQRVLAYPDSALKDEVGGATARGGRLYFTLIRNEANVWVGDVLSP